MSNKKTDNFSLVPGINGCATHSEETRKEPRYHSIGIPLFYSQTDATCADDLADCMYKAIAVDMSLSGLAFDVDRQMFAGDVLYLVLEKPDNKTTFDELVSEVRWCESLSSGRYRVGVTIDISNNGMKLASISHAQDVIGESEVPKEIYSRCPVCKQQTIFEFFSYQPVLARRRVMPLYNCAACGTTRSLMGILSNNRK